MDNKLELYLFVTSTSPASLAAKKNLESALKQVGIEMRKVEIVDVLDNPHKALEAGVIVTPTLAVIRDDKQLLIAGRLDESDRVAARLEGLVS